MLRIVFAALAWLAILAVSDGGAAEPASAKPAGSDRNTPRLGLNFTVSQPTMAMIWIAPGTFTMSSTFGTGDETVVTFTRGYWLGQTEVTQGQWQDVIEAVPIPSFFKGSDHPVEQVSWALVKEFCLKIGERERAAGRLPEGYAYTLPTEAQWEYACRAGTTGIYAGELAAMAWYGANSGGKTHPVAQKQPNAWGFYDMHGNVFEWCADWYAAYPGGKVSDPAGAASGQFRVGRGGSWSDPAGRCRSALRSFGTMTQNFGWGFRLALAPLSNPPAADKP